MPITDLTSRDAVLQAIDEFKQLGQEEFLKRYESHRSYKYVLRYKGKDYDSKAIVRAAYGFQFPEKGFFKGKFKGGDQTIGLLQGKLKFDVVSKASSDAIRTLATTLNDLSQSYDIGQLQSLRKALRGRPSRTRKIFSKQTIHEDYAFHDGGRSEIQFNIGLEDRGSLVRFGLAFSLELGQSLPSIDPLKPKIQRFNQFLRDQPALFQQMKMWVWDENGRSAALPVHEIGSELIRPDIFILVGRMEPAGDVEPEEILTTFDELLPIYRFVEEETDNGIGMPIVGQVLDNGEISALFGVGLQGGMRRSLSRNWLVLISDPFKGLYQDRWEGPVLHYTGMGPVGDQSLSYAQNKTLANSEASGIEVHLLEATEQGRYWYSGKVKLAGKPYQDDQIDAEKDIRKVWMFPLSLHPGGRAAELSQSEIQDIEKSQAAVAEALSTERLKQLASKTKPPPTKQKIQATAYPRSQVITELVKRLANGICDLCLEPAPFLNKKKKAYLECHHVKWLAKGGHDEMFNAVALCPNCHRKMHVLDRSIDKSRLLERADERCKVNGLKKAPVVVSKTAV